MSAHNAGKQARETKLKPSQQDVSTPTTDEDLTQALEDTFPASDPINFAGSVAAGKPSGGASAGAPLSEASAPVGTHPQAGATDVDDGARASDGGGKTGN